MKVINLWVSYFLVWLFIGVLFQKAGIFLLPDLHHPLGLLKGDNLYFHELALRLLNEIELNGLSGAKIWNYHGGQGNIFLIAVSYYLFGANPLFILPINAFIHSLSTLILFFIAFDLSGGGQKKKKSFSSAFYTSLLFLLFPSAVLWAAQLHKDGYAILAWFLYIFSIVKVFSPHLKPGVIVTGLISSNLLMAFIRPHYLGLYFGITALVFFTLILTRALKDKKRLLLIVLSVIAPVVSILLTPKMSELSPIYQDFYKNPDDAISFEENEEKQRILKEKVITEFKWQESPLFPSVIDNQFRTLSFMRFIAFRFNSDANSLLNSTDIPENSFELLLYLPTALTNALLSPYPNWLFTDINLKKLVSIFENIIWYLILALIFWRLPQIIKSPAHLSGLIFALLGMMVIGVFSPTAGNIHRLRVPFQMVMVSLVAGDIGRFLRSYFVRNKPFKQVEAQVREVKAGNNLKGNIIKVALITGVSFSIFFIRDLLVFKSVGINSLSDQLFLGMALPMLVAKVFHHTFGENLILRLTGPYKKNDFTEMSAILGNSTFFLFVTTFVICLALYFIGPWLLPTFTPHLESVLEVWNLSLIILLLSALLLPSKEYLCVIGKQVPAYLSTVLVPISSIVFLMAFQKSVGLSSIVAGMVLGLTLNLCCVLFLVFKSVAFTPIKHNLSFKLNNLRGLSPFLLSALMILSLFPFDQHLITLTGEGNVSLFTFFYKVVLFAMGVITNIMSFAVYPFFAQFFGDSSHQDKNHFYNLCAPSLYFSSLITVIILFLSPWIFEVISFSTAFNLPTTKDNFQLILYFSVGQIPLLIFYYITTKFLFSIQSGMVVTFSSAISFLLNCFLSLAFLRYGEAHHIIMMTNISLMMGNLTLVYFLHKKFIFSTEEAQKIGLSLILYVTILLTQMGSLKLLLFSGLLLLPVVAIKSIRNLTVSHSFESEDLNY